MKIKIFISIFVVIWIIILSRVYYISIKSYAYYEELAKQNAIKTEELAPLRGSILDLHGRPLSVNKLGFSIGIAPGLSSSRKRKELDKNLDFLVETLHLDNKEKLRKRYLKKDSPYAHDFVKVIDFIAYDDVIKSFTKISLNKNLKIEVSSKRYYPYSDLAAHVVGYVGKANAKEAAVDKIAKLTEYAGKTGIEKYYNRALEGNSGIKKTNVTAFNVELDVLEKKLPISQDVSLTLDIELQKYISQLFKGKSGAIIVMNAKNGKILAAGSFPEYDLNNFVSGISEAEWKALSSDFNHPFTNKLISGLYPPGSTIKMGVALAFLESGLITAKTTIFDTGSIELGNRKFRDWKKGGHGYVNLKKAIKESCDTYFYDGSLKVGIDRITPVLERLGFGAKTGVDLPNEFIGIVPGKKWKMNKYQQPWYQGETLITSIGQGYFLVTPMQIARYTALIATGYGVTPHFVDKVGNLGIVYGKDKTIMSRKDHRYLKDIRAGMYEVANVPHGTAYYNLHTKFKIAAKTGTAQVVGIPQSEKRRMKESELEFFHRSHAWLTTYGPYKNPQYVVTVLVEHGGHGGSAAGAIVSKIYNKLLEDKYITLKKH
ncbi:penicillin-binding protein 2 [Sulfurospirillum sp. 1612]|uniref:penicillin-binding protein 2 n=1 Tax=Sulfurospirillum sp. 1612 TaxID=3094835 RepID=UPI002F94FC57